jgi:hypothetical protein
VVGVPSFLVGAALARWWAPAVGLVFIAMLALGERCSMPDASSGATVIGCSRMYPDDLPLVLGLTTPCVVAGVAAIKLWSAWRGRRGGVDLARAERPAS